MNLPHSPLPPAADPRNCTVCGKQPSGDRPYVVFLFAGRLFPICGEGCLESFERDPAHQAHRVQLRDAPREIARPFSTNGHHDHSEPLDAPPASPAVNRP